MTTHELAYKLLGLENKEIRTWTVRRESYLECIQPDRTEDFEIEDRGNYYSFEPLYT